MTLVPALVFGLSACGSEDTTAADKAPADNATAIALPFAPVAHLSPFSDDALLNTRMGVGETLVQLDKDGVAQPWLADSVNRIDDRTVEFTLKKGVKFHDGTEMNSAAVVRSLQAAFDATSRPKGLGKKPLTFTADGEDKVRVQAEAADPILVQRFADAGTIILAESAYTDPASPSVVGTATGPYTITELSDGKAHAEAFGDYWGGAPKLEAMDVEFLTDGGARSNAIRSGEVNLAQAVPIAQLNSLKDIDVNQTPLPRGVYLHLNSAKGAFQDAGLRAAAAKAVHPKDIIEAIYEGHAGDAKGSIFVPTVDWASAADSHNTTEGATDPAGKKITLATWSERPELGEVASVIADQLRAAGFEVDVKVSDYNSMEAALLDGEFDAVIGSRNYQLGAADPVSFLASDYTCDGSYNLSRYCNQDIDQEITKAADIEDMDARFKKAAEIGAQIVGDNAVIPLAHEYSMIATKDLKDVTYDPFERRLITVDTSK
ncbi:ABC transporter substrate-binding protein [Corynebacterium aquilae DSM 44791]|uniref:ABC transporter substrate-binding protein n=1 Tax=Corynebacterium aquilae DSM 44791 TaxID=1431546 RepID=A0A1L7CHA8_9CORY|nr:ABC transporter substrate-binding protein [Corynebacterium aquilae DSM 44791]